MKYLSLPAMALALISSLPNQFTFAKKQVEVQGELTVCDNQLCLKSSDDEKTIKLRGADLNIQQSLRQLTAGDFLQGQGILTEGQLKLQTIFSVGLKSLLGTWQSASGQIYDFVDFSTLDIYLWNPKPTNPQERITYRISPSSGKNWTLFLLKQEIEICTLSISDSGVELTFYDNKTGQVDRQIKLFPFQ